MLPHQLDGIGQDREVDEPKEVELQQAQRLAGAISNWVIVVRPSVARWAA